ncbi:type I pullulanase [Ectobacillus polymachus]|uniref:type I pullulanase n=1 Tax=Ectobacillus polymachus TaxID=1508806 RepID=UPI003A83BC63
MLKVENAFEAYIDRMDFITILLSKAYGVSSKFRLKSHESEWNLNIEKIIEFQEFTKYECKVETSLEMGETYRVVDERNNEIDLQIGAVIRTQAFDNTYYYDGNDLGVTFTLEKTICKVWAPTATKAKVRFYDLSGYKENEMIREQNGVWRAEIVGNCEGAYYTICVYINHQWREAIDPYAKAVSSNGVYGIIIDLEKTRVKKEELALPPCPLSDAIIYEAHIRDFTNHPESGVVCKGKYKGLTEERTKGLDGSSTGLAYLKELGITHLELLPFNDFAGVDELLPQTSYNWGYNPLHYNVPEGSYASDADNPYARILEVKRMIQTLHKHGIRVIMDVVYNHVYIRETSSFELLVPGYYFRHDKDGMPSNGTGVGNDIASERKMVRKFIKDSVLYWLEEYEVDGFRFDLMGILDIETMNEIRNEINRIKKDVMLLGEGWDMDTPLAQDQKATLRNAAQMPNIAQFNDAFRDTVKGSTFNLYDRGYAFGSSANVEYMKTFIAGSIPIEIDKLSPFLEPYQTINYVESHDNATMWDKLKVSNKDDSEDIRKRRHRLATTITLLSQGIPFLHAGQEFFRTKKGIENSYNSPDYINQIDWERKEANLHHVEYIKGMIAIRKKHGAFRLPSTDLVRRHLRFLQAPDSVIMYELCDVQEYGPWKNILVVLNNTDYTKQIILPDFGEWQVLADNVAASTSPMYRIQEPVLLVFPISSYILAKS